MRFQGVLVTLIFILWKIQTCLGQGAPWTAEDQDTIFRRLKGIFGKDKVWKEYTQIYPDYQWVKETQINAPKVLISFKA